MVTNLIFPVQDLDSNTFGYNGNLSKEEFSRLEIEHFNNTYDKVGSYLDGNLTYGQFGYEIQEQKPYEDKDTDKEVEVEALVLKSDRSDFSDSEFLTHCQSGDKFIMIVNLNPTTIDPDAESEIRYWIEDSLRVWKDEAIDQRTKILTSPERNLKIVLSDGVKHTLSKCKIFEEYSDERYPLFFAMLVDKID